jgi:hypothetical protein
MAVTYGHTPGGGDEDPFLVRALELTSIITRVNTPEKAAIFTAIPFRESRNAICDQSGNSQPRLQLRSCQRGASVAGMP